MSEGLWNSTREIGPPDRAVGLVAGGHKVTPTYCHWSLVRSDNRGDTTEVQKRILTLEDAQFQGQVFWNPILGFIAFPLQGGR